MNLGGLNIYLIFRNNINKDVHVHTEEVTVNTVLIPADETIVIPKQPVQGGVGGNPWISVLFRHGDGTPIGEEVLLGRCEQLSKE